MHPRLAVLACLCLVVAGCSGGAPGGEPRTVNPALAETPTASPTPDASDLPPGVSEARVDLQTLLATHQSALSDRSLTHDLDRRYVTPNGTVRAHVVERTRADPIRLYRTTTVEGDWGANVATVGGNRSVWRNDTLTVQRFDGDAASVVVDTEVPSRRGYDATGASTLADLLGPYTLAYDGTVTRDGQTLHRLTLGDVREPSVPLRRNLTVSVFVTPSGIVDAATVRYRTTEFGPTVWVTAQFGLSNVSATTVPRPAWVDAALAERENSSRRR
ncbi:hypothetical protein [Halobaculum limi]|uniref:hypothetical protein n=1 Tax=Halobaculum limi TaxID=3031916 RepID=UPI00240633EE|nr:hypothetical protein [Halobaculum sp. YSMS11]